LAGHWRAVEDAHHGDLAGRSERPLDNFVDDDVGQPWNHQLTRALDPTGAATTGLLGEGGNGVHEPPLDPLSGRGVTARDIIEDAEEVGLRWIGPANFHALL
jgi:hypothetical protein